MALTRKERTLGCLWAMACGDALGVPSSFLTPEQIKSKYGWIDTFYPPEKGHIFHDGLLAGEYTDDTEQSMALMNAYIRDKQVVPMSVVKEIIAWADRVKDKYASPLGPSTERALKNIAAGGDITVSGKWGNTNGSSMRIAPLGIIHGLRGSTLQELARDVALTDLATHNTRVCNAAATAIAWGVAQAHILAQVARHLLSGFIQMRVQNLVANRPHQQRRMIAVAAHPRGDIRRHVGGEEARVVKRRFGAQPHIKRFVYHENAELVA